MDRDAHRKDVYPRSMTRCVPALSHRRTEPVAVVSRKIRSNRSFSKFATLKNTSSWMGSAAFKIESIVRDTDCAFRFGKSKNEAVPPSRFWVTHISLEPYKHGITALGRAYFALLLYDASPAFLFDTKKARCGQNIWTLWGVKVDNPRFCLL